MIHSANFMPSESILEEIKVRYPSKISACGEYEKAERNSRLGSLQRSKISKTQYPFPVAEHIQL